MRIPLVEERLVVDARSEQIGVVRVHKAIVEEQQTIPVILRHEVATIEHVPAPADADPATVSSAFTPQDIVIPVMAERAVVTKEAHIVEEVHVHKENVTEEHTISGTVRKMPPATRSPRASWSAPRASWPTASASSASTCSRWPSSPSARRCVAWPPT
jgi:uncharacterized protein (TIGR02271 family)